MKFHKVIIAGGRDFNNYELLKEICDRYIKDKIKTHQVIIVSGHASGADSLGERYAKEHGLEVELHPADWNKYGKAAGPIRNAEMVTAADALIAFWDGYSLGTANMISQAMSKGLETKVIRYK